MSESSRRPEAPEPPAFPFAALLDDLKARGVGIGLHEYNAVGKLLARWQGASPDEFGNAIASLLAKDERERAIVKSAFAERYLPHPALSTAAARQAVAEDRQPDTETNTGARWQRWKPIAIGAVVAVLVVLAILIVRRPHPGDAGPSPTPGSTPLGDRPPPEDPAPVRVSSWTDLLTIGAIAGGAWCIGTIVFAGVRARRDWVQRLRRATLARLEGPYQYDWNVPLPPALPRSVVEDVAAVLGRTFPEERPGRVMDVDDTLRRTLRAGLWPQIVFTPSVRSMAIVVLRDVSADMRPWRRAADELVSELRRQGIAIDAWTFDRNPAWIARDATGPRIPFAALGARATEEALVVIGTGSGLAIGGADAAAWREHIARWERRAWINPIRHPDEWNPALHDLPLGIWPMTAGGLRRAAIEISTGYRDPSAHDRLYLPRRVTRGDVEQMKRLLAFAPQPTIDLAEALRLRFCPDIPREVVLHLAPDGAPADRIALAADEAERFVVAEERDSPERAKQIRSFLGSLLDRSEPAPASAAHLRWELDAALLAIGRDPASSPAAARESLERLARSPIAQEVAPRMARLTPDDGESSEGLRDLRRAIERRAREAPVKVPAGVRIPAVPSWLFSAPQMVGTIAIAALAIGVGRVAGVSATAVRPHLQNAYRLEYSTGTRAGSLLIASIQRGDAPETVQLYRESEPYGPSQTVGNWRVSEQPGGTYYQVRGRMADGRLALSNWAWVPAPYANAEPGKPPAKEPPRTTPPATTSRDAMSTIEITRIPKDLKSTDVTIDGSPWPGGAIRVGPGEHTIALANGYYDYSRQVTTVGGQTIRVAIDAEPVFGVASIQANVNVRVRVTSFRQTAPRSVTRSLTPNDQPRVYLGSRSATVVGPAGAATLEVTAQNHLPETVQARLIAGERSTYKVELKRDPAKSYDNAAADEPQQQTQQGPPTRAVQGYSGMKAAGIGKDFSPWYEVCADIPAGGKITKVEFRLRGVRTACGEGAECRESSRTETRACSAFRLQRRDPTSTTTEYSEGLLTVTFVPPPASRK